MKTTTLPNPRQVILTAEQSALRKQIETEALTIARDTGKTPRQLAERVNELQDCLKLILGNVKRGVLMGDPKRLTEARNTISHASAVLIRNTP